MHRFPQLIVSYSCGKLVVSFIPPWEKKVYFRRKHLKSENTKHMEHLAFSVFFCRTVVFMRKKICTGRRGELALKKLTRTLATVVFRRFGNKMNFQLSTDPILRGHCNLHNTIWKR